jgi:hypothetical protein
MAFEKERFLKGNIGLDEYLIGVIAKKISGE